MTAPSATDLSTTPTADAFLRIEHEIDRVETEMREALESGARDRWTFRDPAYVAFRRTRYLAQVRIWRQLSWQKRKKLRLAIWRGGRLAEYRFWRRRLEALHQPPAATCTDVDVRFLQEMVYGLAWEKLSWSDQQVINDEDTGRDPHAQ